MSGRLVVNGPDGPRPFMRGILVQSLVSKGVPFDVALRTAKKVREHVQGSDAVELRELSGLVGEFLPKRYALDQLPLRSEEPPRVVSSKGQSRPFSKGLLAVSLQGSGLDPSDAYDVARELEAELLRERLVEIDRSELRERIRAAIERAHGESAASRYSLWRRIAADDVPILVLISGSSGVGKTALAVEVARRLEIARVIGTDSIRQIMRLMFSKDLMPEIHSSTYEAHTVLGAPRSELLEPVVVGFREQAQKIAVGAQALLDRAVEENTSLILEGATLLPGGLDTTRYRGKAHVIELMVAALDPEAYRQRFPSRESRSKRRPAHRYLQHLEAIFEIQEHLLGEAEARGLPIIDNVHFDETVLSVIRSIISTLNKSVNRPVERARGARATRGGE